MTYSSARVTPAPPTNTDDDSPKFNYSVPIRGFTPEDLNITIEGRKVKIHGKHINQSITGRKTHNEFTKMFDLSPKIDPDRVRSYVKGEILYIEAQYRDVEDARMVPVMRKWWGTTPANNYSPLYSVPEKYSSFSLLSVLQSTTFIL